MLVSSTDQVGVPCRFSVARTFGIEPSRAVTDRISAHSSIQASSAPATETIMPTPMRTAPHGPTASRSTPAMDGSCSSASSAWLMMPALSRLTDTSRASTPTKPMTVARPMEARSFARSE